MIAAPFTYVRPETIAQVLALLAKHGDDAKLMAGGQSLIPMMKLRLVNPATIIDLGELADLRPIVRTATSTRLGALVTHERVAADPAIRRMAPALSDAAAVIGDPQIRNRGTIGGSSAHGDPAADYPAVLLALDAEFKLRSVVGERSVRADAFFVSTYETALRTDGELLIDITIEDAPASAYVKLEHPASGYAVVGAAVRLEIESERIRAARVGITGVSDVAFRATGVERALIGVQVNDGDAIVAAARDAVAEMTPIGDQHAPPDYRAAVADVIVARAIQRAAERGRTR